MKKIFENKKTQTIIIIVISLLIGGGLFSFKDSIIPPSTESKDKHYNDDFLKYPTIVEVIDEFFDDYQFEENSTRGDNSTNLQNHFQKKPDGWHVVTRAYDFKKKEWDVIEDELFWDLEEEEFSKIDYPESEGKSEKKKEEYIAGFSTNKHNSKGYPEWNSYFNIFPYHGYDEAGEDVIELLKNAEDLPDSTLYALARSYNNYSFDLLSEQGGRTIKEQFDLANTKNCLSEEQLKKYRFYAHKANEKFMETYKTNPNFETIVGSIYTKASNEYVSSFLNLLIYQNEKEARKELRTGLYDPFIINMSKNYLNSCDEDAILFTNGDNDTYPLLYVQEMYGFRTDVKVINLSLFNTERYIDLMKRASYDAPPIPSSLEHDDYRAGMRDYTPINERFKDFVEVKNVVNFINSKSAKAKVNTSAGLRNYCPAKKLKLTVNKEIAKTFVPEAYQDKIVDEIRWSLKGNGIYKNKLMVLDILAHFNWERPIYFAITVGRDNFMGLEKYFQLEGLAYRLVPYSVSSTDGQTGIVHTNKMYHKLMNEFEWGNIYSTELDFDKIFAERMAMTIRNNHSRLAESLYQEGETRKAVKVLDRCMNEIPSDIMNLSYFSIPIIDIYFKLDEKQKGSEMLATMMDNHLAEYKHLKEFDDRNNLKQELSICSNVLGSLARVLQIHKIEDLTFIYSYSNGVYYKEKEGVKVEIDYTTYRINTFMDEYLGIN